LSGAEGSPGEETTPYTMLIIPAIDLKNGKCVRLEQGRDDRTTVYSGDPAATAREWVRQGARRLHVVNLDGAFGRRSVNLDVVRSIVQSVDAEIEFGGGLRSLEAMRHALDAGIHKIVLGTVAVEQPRILSDALALLGPSRIIVALDGIGGKIATRGWTSVTEIAVEDLVRRLRGEGVEEVLYTDIERDGMLSGPDLPTLELLGSSGLRVIASGGVSSTADIAALRSLAGTPLFGVIVGKALYEKRVTLSELLAAVQEPLRKPEV
jgi:phosphoribosylformimino-5-aminoimidazole carboxamide ribotide isomerase